MKQDHDNSDLTPLSALLQTFCPLPFFCANVTLLMKTYLNDRILAALLPHPTFLQSLLLNSALFPSIDFSII